MGIAPVIDPAEIGAGVYTTQDVQVTLGITLLVVLGAAAFTVVTNDVGALVAAALANKGDKTGRSAPQIFAGALENVQKAPTGWLFGDASALYSNAREEPPPPPPEDTAAAEEEQTVA